MLEVAFKGSSSSSESESERSRLYNKKKGSGLPRAAKAFFVPGMRCTSWPFQVLKAPKELGALWAQLLRRSEDTNLSYQGSGRATEAKT